MKLSVATLVHRILKRMKAFKQVEGNRAPAYLASTLIPTEQVLLGIYENNTNTRKDAVVVTNESLWICGAENAEEVRYEEMISATWSPELKRAANAVKITLHDRTTKFVPVRGEQGGGRDVFEFVRFVSRVISQFAKPEN